MGEDIYRYVGAVDAPWLLSAHQMVSVDYFCGPEDASPNGGLSGWNGTMLRFGTIMHPDSGAWIQADAVSDRIRFDITRGDVFDYVSRRLAHGVTCQTCCGTGVAPNHRAGVAPTCQSCTGDGYLVIPAVVRYNYETSARNNARVLSVAIQKASFK